MKKNNKKIGKNGGFYIALCACAVVVALVSYAGEIINDGDNDIPDTKNIALEEELDFNYESFNEDLYEDEPLEEISEPEVIVIEPEENIVIQAEETVAEDEVYEFMPALPVPGKVLAEFSGANLVKYERLGDWRTHSGIDISANVGDDVYLCEDGVVEKIYQNNLGGCILVEHKNGYKSLYAGLGEIDLVNVGDELHAGETIGRVGESAVGDLTKEPHVHFEIYYEEKPINPLDIITIE